MAHALTLPIIGGLALAGAGLGLHLGNSSISEIDPSFFDDPPTRFHADLVASPAPIDGEYVARADGAETIGLGSGCIGCRDYPEEYYPVQDPTVETYSAAFSEFEDVPAPAPYQQAPATEPVSRPSELERLDRYARFAVSAEEQAPPAPAQAQAPAESEATAIQGEEVAAAD